MALLTEAAGQGHADIMVLLGRAYLDGIRTERDEETAAQWFEKAVAAGSLDACSELAALYMGAAVATEDETQQRSLLTQAKTLLDAGCAHNHAPSMVNLVRCNFLTDPAGYETEEGQQQSLALLHKAAELGETEPYLDVLFRMLDLSDTDSKRQELLALLEEPILEGNAAARLRLHQFGLAQPGLSAEEAKQTLMSAIGAIAAQDKYGPACAFLAEVYAMGMYEQEGSDELAREYIDLGRELRNPRCVTLDMLLEQGFFEMPHVEMPHVEMPHVEMPHGGKQQTDTAAAQAEAASAQQSAEDEAQRARLRALSLHGERMATVHLACRNMMLDREEAWFFLRVQMKTREVRQMIAEFARSLATWVREAMEEHDYGFVCYLALEFLRAARGTLNKELALACVSAFGLELEEGADRNEICLPHVALTLLEMLQDAHVVVLPENAGERRA